MSLFNSMFVLLGYTHKRVLADVFRIGVMKRLKRGISVQIMPSYRCNYNCSYCARKYDHKMPRAEEKTLAEWQRFLRDMNSTIRIREIVLSGGEPTVVSYFGDLCEWILDQGWFLTVYTNMSNINELIQIRQTPRVRIHATHHPEYAIDYAFRLNWMILDGTHRTDVDEIGERRLSGCHKKTNLKPYATQEELNNNTSRLLVAPDFHIYLYCNAAVKPYV